MSKNESGIVELGNVYKKRKIFNPELKNTMSSVVGGAGEASQAASAPTASAGTGAVMASVANDLFLSFIDSLKTPDNINLIESVISGYKIINESYKDGSEELPEYDDYKSENFDSRGDMDGHYRYIEPLDIYVDNRKGYPEFSVYTDGGDHLHTTTDINDAYTFIKKTGNKIRSKPIKSYGNRWLNDMKESTIEDQVYMMDTKWNGRKTVALHKLSNDEIDAIRQKIKNSLNESIENAYKIITESGSYEYDDITDLEHPDDIERAFYGEDEPEKVDPQLDEYNKYIDELVNIIRRYGYWSEQVKEFNETIPYELDTLKIHNAARWQTEH